MYAWRRFLPIRAQQNPVLTDEFIRGMYPESHCRKCVNIRQMSHGPSVRSNELPSRPYLPIPCAFILRNPSITDTDSYIPRNIPDRHTFDPVCSINDAPHNNRTFHTADIRHIGYKRCLRTREGVLLLCPGMPGSTH